MTTLWGIAPVVCLLPPGREVDWHSSDEWSLVIGYPPNQAVIEGTREELFRFAMCVGVAVEIDGWEYTDERTQCRTCGMKLRSEWQLTKKGYEATGGIRAS